MNLNDRHADEPMRIFSEIVDGLDIDGFRPGPALRVLFFKEWLQPVQPNPYPRHRWWIDVLAAGRRLLKLSAPEADVLFVQEGRSERERSQSKPLMDWLIVRGHRVAVISHEHLPYGLVGEISAIAANAKRIMRLPIRKIDLVGRRVRDFFELDASFVEWFRVRSIQAFVRFSHAYHLMSSMTQRPRAVVLISEYHATSRAILCAAQVMSIPIVLVQHGFLGQEWLYHPVQAQKICVWGEVDKTWFVQRGMDKTRIVVTGSPRATTINANHRHVLRQHLGVGTDERTVIFMIPNLLQPDYHHRAAILFELAQQQVTIPTRWFARPHPAMDGNTLLKFYTSLQQLPVCYNFEQTLSMADLVLHDYSSLAFGPYAGVATACLEMDVPYPHYYRDLLGGQPVVSKPETLAELVHALDPQCNPGAHVTPAMLIGGQQALDNIGHVIERVLSYEA